MQGAVDRVRSTTPEDRAPATAPRALAVAKASHVSLVCGGEFNTEDGRPEDSTVHTRPCMAVLCAYGI